MKTVVKRLYEGLFLVDSAEAAADWDGVNTTIKNILEKAGAEIVSIKKWNEYRLAYGIKGKTRGTYILCYFRVDGKKIRDIERDVQLSERIMRVLILSADHMTQEGIEKDTPAMAAEKRRQKAADSAAQPAEVAADETGSQQAAAQQAVEAQQSQPEDSQQPPPGRQEADAEKDS